MLNERVQLQLWNSQLFGGFGEFDHLPVTHANSVSSSLSLTEAQAATGNWRTLGVSAAYTQWIPIGLPEITWRPVHELVADKFLNKFLKANVVARS